MTKFLTAVSALALAAAFNFVSSNADAADLATRPIYKAPVVAESSPWMIRLRALGVVPRDSGYVDQVPGSSLKTSDAVVPELDITYFFTKNIAAELILGVTRHSVSGDGSLTGIDVGKAWLLPPTLTLQYHFTEFGAFKPYVGAGVNYTFFFSQSAACCTVIDSHLKDAFAPAVQIGFDYMIDQHWGFNVDVKKLWLRPEWSGTLANGTPITGKVNLDPWLIGTGITYRF
ncbi:OmpW family protein [Rhodopseudomonas palustris]|uniref:OmpW family protein n=1 Tax=Rhodopseudomonas palustris TaxID=1076 RepID=A0A323UFM3_RHOPL|nr:OmpW family protein [Rhodopseudomonas palustris]PZA10310.1 OmpW family protein [Rhodopseudomonas palustris]